MSNGIPPVKATGTSIIAAEDAVNNNVTPGAGTSTPETILPGDAPAKHLTQGAVTANILAGTPTQQNPTTINVPLSAGKVETSTTTRYSINQNVQDGQEVLIGLPPGELHLIELKYHDSRKLADLRFGWSAPGAGVTEFRANDLKISGWASGQGLGSPQSTTNLPPNSTYDADTDTLHGTWFTALALEGQGKLNVRRESDHNSPWIFNPVRVKVDIVYPDGTVHSVGRKFVDFHVHDAHSLGSSGYPETDNISNGYENLPSGPLPAGCFLRLRPSHENRQPWEADRTTAVKLSWVRPHVMPSHGERSTAFSASNFEKPPQGGYQLEAGRPVAGLLVNWTDHGRPESGRVSFETEDGGHFSSPSYNIGSGETELIPLDGKVPKDGIIRISGGSHLEVRRIEVLYADE